MRIAYFDCFSGISGDMTLGALLDAGLDFKVLDSKLKKLNLSGYRLQARKVKRGELSGTKFDCVIAGERTIAHRRLKDILRLIDRSSLGPRVKALAKEIFENIGKAEAKVHGAKNKDIKFHELGHIDSIIDIVGTAIAMDEFGIDEIYSSNIVMGRTISKTAHGTWPIPSPASLELLKDADVEICSTEAELVTPTGAGILKTLARGFGGMPQMKIAAIGYGAGSMELEDRPNMLRVMIGEKVSAFKEDRIFVIETNIDDMSPQNFEYLFERLFKAGALDVYTTNIQMKKSRPAFKLTVLADPAISEDVCGIIFSETTSIGIRFYETRRFKLDRKIVKVNTKYGEVKVKLSKGPGKVFTASPEYENCAAIARKRNIPLKSVYEAAKSAVKI